LDTKSKKINSGKTGYILLWFLELILTSLIAVSASIFIALKDMKWMDGGTEEFYGYYSGSITDYAAYDRMQNVTGIGCIIGILIAIGLLVILSIMTGRFSRDDKGNIQLNWFDKIWSEIHITAGVGAACLSFISLKGCYYTWMEGDYLGVWEIADSEIYSVGLTREVEFTFFIALLVVCFAMVLLCFMSLVKKLKAKQFWEKSLLGGAFLAIYRSFKSSNKTLFKIMSVLIIGSFLCATWIGLPVVLVLILIFVPKGVKKYIDIKKGVEEVKNGNLEYKIPVEEDKKGIKGEFDRLASDINDISQASNIAVQNELKNQRMKTELISNVSHDLKTPLTSMISYVDLMKKEGLDSPNAAEYLDIIDNKTQRLKTLTENLFDAAKASSGAIPVNIESIELSSLISQSLAEMEERLTERGLDIQVKNNCENIRVMADGQLMWRVIENLLGNVSKYAMDNSRVYINIDKVEGKNEGFRDMVILEVKNISKDQLNISADELMERFKRGDESRNTEGSGLGLAIAKDLVKLMNGVFEITIDGDLFKATVMLEKGR